MRAWLTSENVRPFGVGLERGRVDADAQSLADADRRCSAIRLPRCTSPIGANGKAPSVISAM